MRTKSEFVRWVHLVHLTEEMELLIKKREVSPERIRELLASVDIAFGDLEDPVLEFPCFALKRFCRELSRCLEELPAVEALKR